MFYSDYSIMDAYAQMLWKKGYKFRAVMDELAYIYFTMHVLGSSVVHTEN